MLGIQGLLAGSQRVHLQQRGTHAPLRSSCCLIGRCHSAQRWRAFSTSASDQAIRSVATLATPFTTPPSVAAFAAATTAAFAAATPDVPARECAQLIPRRIRVQLRWLAWLQLLRRCSVQRGPAAGGARSLPSVLRAAVSSPTAAANTLATSRDSCSDCDPDCGPDCDPR